jgi:phage/plasmid primase-like uncharacterized protein
MLNFDGSKKAPVATPRRSYGAMGRGAIRLAPVRSILGLAEGTETALAATAIHKIPCWSSVGAARLDRVEIPDTVTTLVLFGDNDEAGRSAAQKAVTIYTAPGRDVRLEFPGGRFGDWNDVLMNRTIASAA